MTYHDNEGPVEIHLSDQETDKFLDDVFAHAEQFSDPANVAELLDTVARNEAEQEVARSLPAALAKRDSMVAELMAQARKQARRELREKLLEKIQAELIENIHHIDVLKELMESTPELSLTPILLSTKQGHGGGLAAAAFIIHDAIPEDGGDV